MGKIYSQRDHVKEHELLKDDLDLIISDQKALLNLIIFKNINGDAKTSINNIVRDLYKLRDRFILHDERSSDLEDLSEQLAKIKKVKSGIVSRVVAIVTGIIALILGLKELVMIKYFK